MLKAVLVYKQENEFKSEVERLFIRGEHMIKVLCMDVE